MALCVGGREWKPEWLQHNEWWGVIGPEVREVSRAGKESILTGEQPLCMWQEWCLQGRVLSPWEERSVSQVWDQVTSTIRPAGPIIDLGLFYRNPKSNWKPKGGNPHFSLQHLPYFSSEKAHYVQQRKPQPFPEKWIMRDSNWERERERNTSDRWCSIKSRN